VNLFITGTDTDIGKTVVTTAIALGLQSLGFRVAPMKPIQSGAEAALQGLAPDLQPVLQALDIPLRHEMCSYLLTLPASPHLAAAKENIHVSIERILEDREVLLNDPAVDVVIAEGAGGVLVPVNENQTMLDLMTAFDWPIVLVARSRLGTLNHSLLSIQALKQAGLSVCGFVTVDTDESEWGEIEADNVKTISSRGAVSHLGHIPWMPELSTQVSSPPASLREIGRKIVENILSR